MRVWHSWYISVALVALVQWQRVIVRGSWLVASCRVARGSWLVAPAVAARQLYDEGRHVDGVHVRHRVDVSYLALTAPLQLVDEGRKRAQLGLWVHRGARTTLYGRKCGVRSWYLCHSIQSGATAVK
eukprot:COSAG02_NODE_8456_length_2558_cov_180.648824_2_plen_127_part_00